MTPNRAHQVPALPPRAAADQRLLDVPLFGGRRGEPRVRVDPDLPAAGARTLESVRSGWQLVVAAGRSTRTVRACTQLSLVAVPPGSQATVVVDHRARLATVPKIASFAETPLIGALVAGLLNDAPMATDAWRRHAPAEPVPLLAALCALVTDPAERTALAGAFGLAAVSLEAWVEAEAEAEVWALAHPDPAVADRACRRAGSTCSPLLLPRLAAAAQTARDTEVRERICRAHHRLGRRFLATEYPAATAVVRRNTYRGRYRRFDELVADLVELLDPVTASEAADQHHGIDLAAWREGSGPAVVVVDEAASDGRCTADLAVELRTRALSRPTEVLGRDVNLAFAEVWPDPATVGVVDSSGRCLWCRVAAAEAHPLDDRSGSAGRSVEDHYRNMATASTVRRFRWLAPDVDRMCAEGESVSLGFESHDLFQPSRRQADIVRAFGVLYERQRADADADSYFTTDRISAGLRQLGRGLRPGGVLLAGSVVDRADDTATFTDVDVFQRRDDPEPKLVRVHRLGLGVGPGAPLQIPLPDTEDVQENRLPMHNNGAAPGTDVWTGRTAAVFEPWPAAQVHVEWGSTAAKLGAALGDDIVVVDVLSFSTTLTLAAEHGIHSYVYSATELDSMGGRDAVARSVGARPAAAKRAAAEGEVSLSPASIVGASGLDAVLFTSLNGALAVSTAGAAPFLALGCLRNYRAVARLVARRLATGDARRVTMVACGEHWSSVSDQDGLRPCLEDLLGAGAIVAELLAAGCTASPEAAAAAAMFRALGDLPAEVVGARELVAAGFADDVRLAAQLDVTDLVPVRDDADSTGRRFHGVPAGQVGERGARACT